MTREAQLVRHGGYDHNNGRLTAAGLEQAEMARDILLAKELGTRVIVLSSDAIRAVETSQIIASGLGAVLVYSERIRRGGEQPWAVGNLGEFLEESLRADSETTIDTTDSAFVVVTHAPLIAEVTAQSSTTVEYGQVYPVFLDWTNPDYKELDAEYILSGGFEF